MEDIAGAASTYLAWWNMAGVDCATAEAPTNWLRPTSANSLPQSNAIPLSAPKPASLHDFKNWLAEYDGQPERRWPGTPILPQGQAGAPLMVITDMPDPADMETGALFADRAGRLFDAILLALGLSREAVYISSLFCSRPPGGMIEAAELSAAADRMRAHVSLVAPGKLLVLGDRTIRAFLPAQGGNELENLHFVNHDGSIVPLLATFHPRLLLGQPAAKAECWRTLQHLVEEMHQ